MISFKILDNRRKVAKKVKELEQKLDKFKEVFLQKCAVDIVLNSPVDTGTYMDAHTISNTRYAPFTSSQGKPRKQDWQTYADAAIERMFAQIANLPGDISSARVSNGAGHANIVEYSLGYAPYTTTKNRLDVLAEEARIEVGL